MEAWPWELNSIGLITVEHNYEAAKRRRIQKVLQDRGMTFAYHVDVDDWFQNTTLYSASNATVYLHGNAMALAAGASELGMGAARGESLFLLRTKGAGDSGRRRGGRAARVLLCSTAAVALIVSADICRRRR